MTLSCFNSEIQCDWTTGSSRNTFISYSFQCYFFPFLLLNYHHPPIIVTTSYLDLFSLNSTKSEQTFPFVFFCVCLHSNPVVSWGQSIIISWSHVELVACWGQRYVHSKALGVTLLEKTPLEKMNPAAFPHLEISFWGLNANIFLLDLKWTWQFLGFTDFFLQR